MASKITRQSLFGLNVLKKKFELIPLVVAIGVACVGATGYTFYAAYQKPDVRFNKYAEQPPWESVNPETPQKLVNLNPQKYKKIPELEALRKEIGSYKY